MKKIWDESKGFVFWMFVFFLCCVFVWLWTIRTKTPNSARFSRAENKKIWCQDVGRRFLSAVRSVSSVRFSFLRAVLGVGVATARSASLSASTFFT